MVLKIFINTIAKPHVKRLTEARGKLLTLNCNILKTVGGRKFKFGKNAFKTFPNILVNSEKLDLNALLKF